MSRLLMYGIKQQKRKNVLGFETYCAPDGFDRTAQPVDIYDVFNKYYKTNSNAKYIFSVPDATVSSVITYSTVNGTSFRYGYTSSGVDYVVDLNETTIQGGYSAGNRTTIPAVSVTGFPASGTITIGAGGVGRTFIYTSVDTTPGANAFVGSSQNMYSSVVGENVYVSSARSITWVSGSTKRWIIVNNYTTSSMVASVRTADATWLYCGNLINSISTVSGSKINYIHCDKLSNITYYPNSAHVNGKLTGNLYLSSSASTIGGICFYGNSLLTGTLTIPNNFTEITGNTFGAFQACTGFTNLALGSSLTTIGKSAFKGCTNLSGTLTIPNSVTSIGEGSFSDDSKFTSLSIGNGVLTIGVNAFYNCSGFDGTLTIPSSVTAVDNYAFYNCSGFDGTLTIPSGITSLGYAVFALCNFNDIDVSANSNFAKSDYVLYNLTSGVKAAYSCLSNSNTITFRNDVTEIQTYCCYNNKRTGTVDIPNTVTYIGDYAFSGCTITGLTFSSTSSVSSIGNYAFQNSKITGSVTFPNSLNSIGNSAFFNCNLITGVSFGTGLATINTAAFQRCSGLVGTLTITSNITTLGNYVFLGNKYTTITSSSTNYPAENNILYDVKTSGQIKAIINAGSNTSVTFRADVTHISDYTFYGYTSISGTINIPSTVTSIGSYAFNECSNITQYNLYPSTAPTVSGNSFSPYAKPLHIPTSSSGYTIAPWTTTSIFATKTADL